MQEINRTEIATLGEFGLIKHLTKDIELKNPETQYGVGDDAAVLEFKDKEVLVTTDLLMEGVHFHLVYTPLKSLGYKSAILNFSDIYAMNGTPKQITVSIALSKRFCIEDLEQFYDGLKLACDCLLYTSPILYPESFTLFCQTVKIRISGYIISRQFTTALRRRFRSDLLQLRFPKL